MEDINSLENSFKDLQEYSDAQFKLISDLKKQVEKLQSENISLKQIIEGNLPSLEFNGPILGVSNEQLICVTQIALLKDLSLQRALTADETRKFATFVEVLEKIKQSSKNPLDVHAEKMSDEELLRLVVNNESEKTSR